MVIYLDDGFTIRYSFHPLLPTSTKRTPPGLLQRSLGGGYFSYVGMDYFTLAACSSG